MDIDIDKPAAAARNDLSATRRRRKKLGARTRPFPSREHEHAELLNAVDGLRASDQDILVHVIGRVAELERLHGEEIALAMLESAVVRIGLSIRLS